jgi:hypothetical protein
MNSKSLVPAQYFESCKSEPDVSEKDPADDFQSAQHFWPIESAGEFFAIQNVD